MLFLSAGAGYLGRVNTAPGELPNQPVWKRAFGLLGIVAHLVVGYFYLTAGLVTPVSWLVGFLLVWVVLLVVGVLLLRRHPLWVLMVPALALVLLVGGVSLGGALLGWNA